MKHFEKREITGEFCYIDPYKTGRRKRGRRRR
jgi:hypothetical protein